MKYLLSANLKYIYQSSARCTNKKRKKERLGQYNSNNKRIHGQYTRRYNLHLSHSLSPSLPLPLSLSHTYTHARTHAHTHTPQQVK